MTEATDRTGPAVVAVGGGHGLAVTLRAARRYAASVTAVVSVADDGGSSGRLRELIGMPAPGDIRRCLGALADPVTPWAAALEHRFSDGELDGHTLGNLVLAGLTQVSGDFVRSVDEVARIVGAAGLVVPATATPVVLVGNSDRGDVRGQTAIQDGGGVTDVWLDPTGPSSPPRVAAALADADQVVLGPGSLYTSVLAAAIVPAVAEAIRATRARRVYVANLRPQPPETAGYTVADHVAAVVRHGLPVDVVLADRSSAAGRVEGVEVVEADLADPDSPTVHHPARLAEALGALGP